MSERVYEAARRRAYGIGGILVGLLVWLGVFRVAVTVLFLGWAIPIVGQRAVWLAAIGWVHRFTRHRRAAMYRHELVRKTERAVEGRTRSLAATRVRLPSLRPRVQERRRDAAQAPATSAPAPPPPPPADPPTPPAWSAPEVPPLEPILPRWLGGGRWRAGAMTPRWWHDLDWSYIAFGLAVLLIALLWAPHAPITGAPAAGYHVTTTTGRR